MAILARAHRDDSRDSDSSKNDDEVASGTDDASKMYTHRVKKSNRKFNYL